MHESDKWKRAMRNALTKHLRDEEFVSYYDGTLSDGGTRDRIELHLELCGACRRRLDDLVLIQLPEGASQVQDETLQPQSSTTPISVLLRGPKALGSFIRTQWQRLIPPDYFAPWKAPWEEAAVPAFKTESYPKHWMPETEDLIFSINKKETGFFLRFRSECLEWAGCLIKFTCMAKDNRELLTGFTVLSDTFEHFRSQVHLPPETAERLNCEFQVVIDPLKLEDLTDDDVQTLRWSTALAADEVSRQAWQASCRRLKPLLHPGSLLDQWCTETEG